MSEDFAPVVHGLQTAAALVARVVAGYPISHESEQLVYEIEQADNCAEVITSLATIAATYAIATADLQCRPVAAVMDQLAADVISASTEIGEG